MRSVPYKIYRLDSGDLIHSVPLNVQLSLEGIARPRIPYFEVTIDSGASRCIFPARFASMLGLELKSGRKVKALGVGRVGDLWIHPVTLHVAGESVSVEAGFAEEMTSSGLLGLTGFFSNFDVTFDSVLRECRFERAQK